MAALERVIVELGAAEIILKSDDEPAILDLRRRVAANVRASHGIGISFETSPQGDSQSNGLAEMAVRELKGVVRSLRHACATLHGVEIGAKDASLPWMVAYAGA
eukprot:2997537-Lingulodinium_polyedra.AAC.1